MKRFLFTLVCLSSLLFCATGCLFDNTLLYSDSGMCNVQSPTSVISDGGIVYNITENVSGATLTPGERLFIECDVLQRNEENEDEYDIRLNTCTKVTVKTPIDASSADWDEVGDDALNVYQGWIGNGYINTLLQFTSVTSSDTEHSFDLVFDDAQSNADTLYFDLKHNGYGECFDNEDVDTSKLGLEGKYVSFKISDYADKVNSTFIIRVRWEWYAVEGNAYVRQREAYWTDFSCRR